MVPVLKGEIKKGGMIVYNFIKMNQYTLRYKLSTVTDRNPAGNTVL